MYKLLCTSYYVQAIMYKLLCTSYYVQAIMYKLRRAIMYKKREHSRSHTPFSPRYFFSSVLYRLYS
jgi:hypothetical protein